jgi:hypothetical protein
MDEISRAQATKRDGQASCPPNTTNLPSTASSAIRVGRSAPRPRASVASAALTTQPRTPAAEPRLGSVRPSTVRPSSNRLSHPKRIRTMRRGDDA